MALNNTIITRGLDTVESCIITRGYHCIKVVAVRRKAAADIIVIKKRRISLEIKIFGIKTFDLVLIFPVVQKVLIKIQKIFRLTYFLFIEIKFSVVGSIIQELSKQIIILAKKFTHISIERSLSGIKVKNVSSSYNIAKEIEHEIRHESEFPISLTNTITYSINVIGYKESRQILETRINGNKKDKIMMEYLVDSQKFNESKLENFLDILTNVLSK